MLQYDSYFEGVSLRLSSQVGFTVFMNVVGAIFAIILIALYSKDLKNACLLLMCDNSLGVSYDDDCRNVALLVQVVVQMVHIGWSLVNVLLASSFSCLLLFQTFEHFQYFIQTF